MLAAIKKEFEREKSFENMQILLPEGLEQFAEVFKNGGADVNISQEHNSCITVSSGTFLSVIDVKTCRMFDNKCYGIGQVVWTRVTGAIGLMIAGKTVVVAGYGAKAKDIAGVAKSFGARVIITESDTVRALEAVMDGFDVLAMDEAARYGDVFVTATDSENVISEKAFMVMKDSAVLFSIEASCKAIDTGYLEETYIEKEIRGNDVIEYELMNGRCIKVITLDCVLSSMEMTELDNAVLFLMVKKLAAGIADGSATVGKADMGDVEEVREEVPQSAYLQQHDRMI